MTHPISRPRAEGRSVPSFGWAFLLGAFLTALPASAHAQQPLSLADPGLTRAIQDTVVWHSPELASVQASSAAARARIPAAGAPPPVILSGEVDDVPDGFDVADAGFRLEVGRELMTGGRTAAGRALAAAEVGLAEARLVATERRLEARTLQHLARIVTLVRTGGRLAAEDSLLAAAETALRDRFSVGDARYVDLLRLRTERLRVQTDRARVQADARGERETLAGLAGAAGAPAVEALVDSALALPTAADAAVPPPPPLDSLLALAGEIGVARATLGRAGAAREVTRAAQRPRISAAVGAQRRFEGGSTSFGPVVSGSISLPFTRGEANRAESEAAEREVEAAEARLAATMARVRSSLAAALTRYEASRDRVDAIDSALLQGARDEREAALGAYRSGDLSLLEFLDFERALARAEIERLRARADAAEAYANLISAATGEG